MHGAIMRVSGKRRGYDLRMQTRSSFQFSGRLRMIEEEEADERVKNKTEIV